MTFVSYSRHIFPWHIYIYTEDNNSDAETRSRESTDCHIHEYSREQN